MRFFKVAFNFKDIKGAQIKKRTALKRLLLGEKYQTAGLTTVVDDSSPWHEKKNIMVLKVHIWCSLRTRNFLNDINVLSYRRFYNIIMLRDVMCLPKDLTVNKSQSHLGVFII